jgi:hypothetical protein
VPSFISRNLSLVLQSESDVVQPFEQAMAGKLVNLKCSGQSMVIVDFALLEIDCDLIVVNFRCPASNLADFVFAQNHRKHAILHTIVGKDIGERWRNEDAKTEILERPHGMFSRGSTTEILSRYQNTRARIARMVENKRRVVLAIAGAAPIEQQKLAEPGALNPLQKLLGNDLIGINIGPMKRRNTTFVDANGFHGSLLADQINGIVEGHGFSRAANSQK